MKTQSHLFLFAAMLLAATLLPLHAQIVADGATNTLSNVTNSFPGNLIIGTNGSFTLLTVSNNALLASALDSVIGLDAMAKSNEVRLISSSARWQMGNNLYVGSNGAFSRLVVSNGAYVEDFSGTLGFRAASSNNFALVTGSGSLWSNRNNLTIGNLGAGNQLIISNGGLVANKFGYVGGSSSASNNSALVSGSSSVWSNQFDLYVGFLNGASNRLVIEAGGLVSCDNGYIGESGGASNNVALVTGPGSLWSNRTRLVVGLNGTVANRLTVSNGAVVWTGDLSSGGGVGGRSNQVLVTGSGSVWTNQSFWSVGGSGNRVDVNNSGGLADTDGTLGGGFGSTNNTFMLAGSSSVWNNSGDLKVGDGGDANTFIASNGATVLSSNALIGASSSLGNNNFALLTGAGTLWSNQNNFTVGNFGTGNRLVVSNGATVFTGGNVVLGANNGADTNSVLVRGAGTRWLSGGALSTLIVGSNGSFNTMTISSGALVTDREGTVGLWGFGGGGSNNTLFVTGEGTYWSNANSVSVGGVSSTGNRLDIGNLALVEDDYGSVGGSTGFNNDVVVHDVGATWNNHSELTVGYAGSGNRLTVTNGGSVFVGGYDLTIGVGAASANNRVFVDGGTLRVTNASGTAVLDVRRGTNVLNSGTMEVDRLVVIDPIVGAPNSFGNGTNINIPPGSAAAIYPSSVTPAGLGGSVTNVTVTLSNLSHAHLESLDVLLVSPVGTAVMLMSGAGGSHSIANATLTFDDTAATTIPLSTAPASGAYRPASYRGVTTMPAPAPSGPYGTNLSDLNGSNPNGAWRLYVADDFGFSGSLSGWSLRFSTATAGGKFEFNGGTLITRGMARSSTAPFSVNGSGATPSTWDVRAGVSNHYLPAYLYVGSNSSFNQLLITNGAVLTNTLGGGIGLFAGANSNLALLSGAGSTWNMGSGLYVGGSGSGNQLVVSNGAFVLNGGEGHIGDGFGSSNNTVLVTGAGSVWSNMDTLFVGFSGTGSRLVISDGGTVFTPSSLRLSTTNSRIVVDDGTLRATNAAGSAILRILRGTNVVNSGLVEADMLFLTDTQGFFEFNGGTLKPGRTTCNNGRLFTVGDGMRAASLQLSGGTHGYTNGLLVANRGTLAGFGIIVGALTVSSGGTLSPGDGIGTLIVTGLANLQGTTVMEAFKFGASPFNDLVQVSNMVIYGGSLTVSNVGVAAFAPGDNFKLFSAPAYAGSFLSLNLPPLDAGLGWTNKLLMDGSIEVIRVPTPGFSNISRSGTNVVISGTNGLVGANYEVLTATNIALPFSDWASIATNQFDSSGNFRFTNRIIPGELQRYFRLRTP